MRMTPFVSGVAAGLAAGAVASAMAAGAMQNTQTRRAVKRTAHQMGDAARHAENNVADMLH